MRLKSPHDPILLSDEDILDLEKMFSENEKRKKLTETEKELLRESEKFDVKL